MYSNFRDILIFRGPWSSMEKLQMLAGSWESNMLFMCILSQDWIVWLWLLGWGKQCYVQPSMHLWCTGINIILPAAAKQIGDLGEIERSWQKMRVYKTQLKGHFQFSNKHMWMDLITAEVNERWIDNNLIPPWYNYGSHCQRTRVFSHFLAIRKKKKGDENEFNSKRRQRQVFPIN